MTKKPTLDQDRTTALLSSCLLQVTLHALEGSDVVHYQSNSKHKTQNNCRVEVKFLGRPSKTFCFKSPGNNLTGQSRKRQKKGLNHKSLLQSEKKSLDNGHKRQFYDSTNLFLNTLKQ